MILFGEEFASEFPSSEFQIQSTAAPLVEVRGDGPYEDRPDGLEVPVGAPTASTTSLLRDFVRKWRVDAPTATETTVSVPVSPFGALVGVRRKVATSVEWRWSLRDWLAQLLRVSAPKVGAARGWRQSLLDWIVSYDWEDVVPSESDTVAAQGGDVVVVSFVVP